MSDATVTNEIACAQKSRREVLGFSMAAGFAINVPAFALCALARQARCQAVISSPFDDAFQPFSSDHCDAGIDRHVQLGRGRCALTRTASARGVIYAGRPAARRRRAGNRFGRGERRHRERNVVRPRGDLRIRRAPAALALAGWHRSRDQTWRLQHACDAAVEERAAGATVGDCTETISRTPSPRARGLRRSTGSGPRTNQARQRCARRGLCAIVAEAMEGSFPSAGRRHALEQFRHAKLLQRTTALASLGRRFRG